MVRDEDGYPMALVGEGLDLLGAEDTSSDNDSSVRSPTSTRTEVRSPTSTSTEVRSPTRTSTETEAHTTGNFTLTATGGAGAGANTTVTVNLPGYGDTQRLAFGHRDTDETRAAQDGGSKNMPSAARSQMTVDGAILGYEQLNDTDMYDPHSAEHNEFNGGLEDEYGFDAHYPPGVEIGGVDADNDFHQDPLNISTDYGSGSCAEDGRREVAEDKVINDGESQVGSAAMYGPTEIGVEDEWSSMGNDDEWSSMGAEGEFEGIDRDYNTDVGAGQAADRPGTEIGAGQAADRPGTEIGHARNAGYIAKYGQSEIGHGHYPIDGASELGNYAEAGFSEIGAGQAADRPGTEIGNYAEAGFSEIGGGSHITMSNPDVGYDAQNNLTAGDIEPTLTPFDTFMAEDIRLGADDEWSAHEYVGRNMDDVGRNMDDVGFYGNEFGAMDSDMGNMDDVGSGHYPTEGASEIGKAVAKVIEKARDNRQPAPPMRAASVDEPLPEEPWELQDVVIGQTVATGADLYPLLSQLLLRAGAGMDPRHVRVDTEESYKAFRTEHSPELSHLADKLEEHLSDPNAHSEHAALAADTDEEFADSADDLVHLGADVAAAEAAKRVELWMPHRFNGKVEAWKEGEFVCVSMALPGSDGKLRICTSYEPVVKCVEEMSRHAAEANVPASTVVGVLPAMGCVLGAGTVLKEMAAAAPAILNRPEAAFPVPFEVRIEPKVSPNFAALAMLCAACKQGNTQACEEWNRLAATAHPAVKAAMAEVLELVKASK